LSLPLLSLVLFFAVTVIITALGLIFKPRRKCPVCNHTLSKIRKPSNFQEVLWGGVTCPSCGTELDNKGKIT
jgi:hypothetical protein